MLPTSRDRILEAAIRVYADHGFKGATTRRIADEAGVNEITVFRHFGSKEALITAALGAVAAAPSAVDLPAVPVDPERELTAWAVGELADLREHRALIRRVISEMVERPEIVQATSQGAISAEQRLHDYVARLHDHGFLTGVGDADEQQELDRTAVSMLMSALFADAMWRDAMPAACAPPVGRVPAVYVRTFLRALGADVGRAPAAARAAPLRAAAGSTSRKAKP